MKASVDDILERINYAKEAELRIYLGGSPGVGKTYRMLQDGNSLRTKGVDVVVGYVETHGRNDTHQQIGALEVILRKKIEYRGRVFEEMDTAAIIARKPQLALVDELAHTNITGADHEKRYQDIEDLLAAGIAVFSTCNVQHLESVHDTVERLTGVEVRERVPDTFFNLAKEVIMVDVSADELRDRLRAGKIYRPEKIEQSLNNFFTHANISLLREMALREVANDLEQKDKEQRQSQSSAASSEKVMVAITDEPSTRSLIRYGSRMAGRINAKWYVVHVEAIDLRQRTPELERSLAENIKLAKLLGARVVELKARDIARALQEFAAEEGVTHILLGSSQRAWWERLFAHSVVSKLLKSIGEIAVHVFPLKEVEEERPLPAAPKNEFRFSQYVQAENILASIHGITTVEQSIAILMDHMIRVYPTLAPHRAKLLDAVVQRERLMSTFLETGIAIPHAAGIEEITDLCAVMALVPEGVNSLGRDKKAFIILLFISPEVGRSNHLKFLAATATLFSDETTVREIAASPTAQDAIELIQKFEQAGRPT